MALHWKSGNPMLREELDVVVAQIFTDHRLQLTSFLRRCTIWASILDGGYGASTLPHQMYS